MIKNLLVAIDGSVHSKAAEDYALWLAHKLDAGLVVQHVVDIVSIEGSFLHDISGSLGFEPYLDFSARMREALQERGRALVEAVAERAEAEGIRCEKAVDLGIVANEICDRARTADLVLLGHRGANERFSTELLGTAAEGVTRKCSAAVWVCPPEFRQPTRALLAYDGSEASVSAMHATAELCTAIGLPLAVLHVGEDREATERLLAEAQSYLDAYDLALDTEAVQALVPEGIVDAAGPDDLLCIGAYGHSRIVELVLGSTTEYVLRNAPGAVFLHR